MQVIIEMVDQYVAKHGRKPERIILTPYAAVALALSQGVSSACNGIKLVAKEFSEEDVCREKRDVARSLGVFVRKPGIRCCDLKVV